MSKPIKRCSIVADGDESKLGCASDLTWLMLGTHQLPIHGKIVHSLNHKTLKWQKKYTLIKLQLGFEHLSPSSNFTDP